MQLLTGKEYQPKTSGQKQMWATDALYFRVSFFRVVGLGLLLHGDRDGRLLLVHPGLEATAGHGHLIQVVQMAIDATGMTEIPLEGRTRLLSDNGSSYVSRVFRKNWPCEGSIISWLRLTILKPTGNWSGNIRSSSRR